MENKSFEIPNYEVKPGYQDMSKKFEQRKAQYEKIAQKVEDKKIVKEVIDDIFEKANSKKSIVNVDITPQSIFDEACQSDDSRTVQVLEDLVNVALNKGIDQAIALSYKTSNLYIMDKFHDMLVDIFYDMLKQKNKIKN